MSEKMTARELIEEAIKTISGYGSNYTKGLLNQALDAEQKEKERLKTDKYMLIQTLISMDDLWLEHSISHVDKHLLKELQALKKK